MADKKVKYRLKGHESFTLREGWLTKGLMAVYENPGLFSENFGADELGVGTNMAKAIRYWLRCAGLTVEESKGRTKLTPLAESLLQKDAYFEDDFSLWLIHTHIAKNFEQATSWYLFFNAFEQENFTKREMQLGLRELFTEMTGAVAVSERSLQDDCEAILHMYSGRDTRHASPEEKRFSPFYRLGLIREQEGIYHREQPDLKRLDALIVLYVMQDMLKRTADCYGSSVSDLLRAAKSPGRVLQIRRSFLMQYLEELERKGYLALNRTAGLDMVYQKKLFTQEEILQEYFGG